jgi:hypothetical protein
LSKGDQVIGQAFGEFELGREFTQELGTNLDSAIYIAVKHPRHPSLKPPAPDDPFAYQVLWFERADVNISHQTSERYLEIRNSYLNPDESETLPIVRQLPRGKPGT